MLSLGLQPLAIRAACDGTAGRRRLAKPHHQHHQNKIKTQKRFLPSQLQFPPISVARLASHQMFIVTPAACSAVDRASY